MEKADLPTFIRMWKGYYAQILQLAEEQRAELAKAEIDWGRFSKLAAEIDRNRQLAEEASGSLRETIGEAAYEPLFRQESYPIAIEAQGVINAVIQSAKIRIQEVGTDLRHTREHQRLNRAYYGMDRENVSAYYFDAKQ